MTTSITRDDLTPRLVCTISYRCQLAHEIEEDVFEGFWTGDVDYCGKLTFRRIDGRPAHYLFEHELVCVSEFE
jgi:hypothetical protein